MVGVGKLDKSGFVFHYISAREGLASLSFRFLVPARCTLMRACPRRRWMAADGSSCNGKAVAIRYILLYHSCTSPSSLLRTLALAQYRPVTSPISAKASRKGIFAPSAGDFGGLPTRWPMSVFTQPGQQALIVRPGLSRARMRVMALTQALEKE